MENRIDATISDADRDKILDLLGQIRVLLPFQVNLTPEERHTLVKMGDKSRPFVEQTLIIAEQDNSFLPRSFEVAEMRQDKELYDSMSPVFVQMTMLFENIQDTMLLVGSDLMLGALEIYSSAKRSNHGAALDSLVPLLGRRFSRKSGKEDDGDEDDENPNPPNPPNPT